MSDLRHQHRAALDVATEWTRRVTAADLGRPTPCAQWDLAALLGHMVGQHVGFAAAVRDLDAPPAAYVAVPYTPARWDASVADLLDAFAAADLDTRVVEIELAATPLPIAFLVAAQFLDTVVHTWDLARSLGENYEPPAEVAGEIGRIAAGIPDDERRDRPRAAFAHAGHPGTTVWESALARLGRTAHG